MNFSSHRKLNVITFHLFTHSSFIEHLLSICSVPDTGNTEANKTGSLLSGNPENGGNQATISVECGAKWSMY